MLEITRGEFADDVLKQANQEFGLFPDSEFICMNLFLAFGDISNLKSVNSRDVLGETVEVKNQITNLLKTAIRHKEIRIWTSTATTEDYLNMMFVLDLLKSEGAEFDIRIIDSVNVPVSDTYLDTPAWELACLEADSIQKLLAFEEKVTDAKAYRLLQDWNDIINKNSSLRICKNGIIESVEDNYFDHIMIDALIKLGEADKSELIGHTMAMCNHDDGNLSDWFFADRLEELLKLGKLKACTIDGIESGATVTLV